MYREKNFKLISLLIKVIDWEGWTSYWIKKIILNSQIELIWIRICVYDLKY